MRRRWPSALLVALILAVVAACGPDDPEGRSLLRVAEAADRTSAASSARMTMTTVFSDSPEMADAGDMTAEGIVDFAGNRGQISLQVPLPVEAGGDQSVEMVFDDMVVYMQMQMPGMPAWLRFDLSEMGFDELAQLGGNDPSASLQFLQGAYEPEELGREEVRGDETTHYRLMIDLERAKQDAGDRGAGLIDRTIDQLGTTTFPMQLWIDGQDRVRRMRWSHELSAIESGAAGTMEQTIEYYDFGAPVDITLPPEDQVMDISPEMLRQMEQAGS